jgi:hypothetical protein
MNLASPVERSILRVGNCYEAIDIDQLLYMFDEPRYRMNCTFESVHGCVTTPWNRITIPRRCALPYTTSNALFTLSNRGC